MCYTVKEVLIYHQSGEKMDFKTHCHGLNKSVMEVFGVHVVQMQHKYKFDTIGDSFLMLLYLQPPFIYLHFAITFAHIIKTSDKMVLFEVTYAYTV